MTITPVYHTKWNTGRNYSLEGQNMEAWVTENPSLVVFFDSTRYVAGVIPVASEALAADINDSLLRRYVMIEYDNNRRMEVNAFGGGWMIVTRRGVYWSTDVIPRLLACKHNIKLVNL